MKAFIITSFLAIIFACNNNNIAPQEAIIGKWTHTYQIKEKEGKWHTINTLVALPTLEFKSNGSFLINDKKDTDCCGYTGNKYSFIDGKLTFSELAPCTAYTSCITCKAGYQLVSIKNDTLIMNQCSVQNKYVRIK